MYQIAMEKHNSKFDEESGQGQVSTYIDAGAEKSCVRKLDFILLPFLSLVSVLVYDTAALIRHRCTSSIQLIG